MVIKITYLIITRMYVIYALIEASREKNKGNITNAIYNLLLGILICIV
ncbi:hypothetical protein SAMN02745248_02412 [Hathewaya proteolytica DSM 3090]|uniref:Uncharacterized protein n=1 Tax=Hathewaya proteolytica DSM 3090 TaxID=1121331 RepID=A0A1M6S0K5_9CLOT|nr:hypothetical protein SAMN02745248_02412 [Hathewaya proteolytica DSM 3090]